MSEVDLTELNLTEDEQKVFETFEDKLIKQAAKEELEIEEVNIEGQRTSVQQSSIGKTFDKLLDDLEVSDAVEVYQSVLKKIKKVLARLKGFVTPESTSARYIRKTKRFYQEVVENLTKSDQPQQKEKK